MEPCKVTSDDGDETCEQQGVYGEDLRPEGFVYSPG